VRRRDETGKQNVAAARDAFVTQRDWISNEAPAAMSAR